MTGKEMIKILEKTRTLDNTLRYWIFKEYIEDYNDLEFLKAEIECEIEKRKRFAETNSADRTKNF